MAVNAGALAWGGGSIAELIREIDGELGNPKNAGLYKTKEKERFERKGAIADGTPVTWAVGKAMPTRAGLLSQIAGMIIGPGSQLAACLQGPGAQLASQISQKAEAKEGEQAAAS